MSCFRKASIYLKRRKILRSAFTLEELQDVVDTIHTPLLRKYPRVCATMIGLKESCSMHPMMLCIEIWVHNNQSSLWNSLYQDPLLKGLPISVMNVADDDISPMFVLE